jgi:hypothetical protein
LAHRMSADSKEGCDCDASLHDGNCDVKRMGTVVP